MTITIVPDTTREGRSKFQARAGTHEATGATVGAALDAITAELSEEGGLSSTLVLVQRFRPDPFFTKAQQDRLTVLMKRWRTARDSEQTFYEIEQQELDALIQAEVHGMKARAQALLDEAKS